MVDPTTDQHRTAMPLGVDRPLVVLLRGHGREPVDPAPEAVDHRRAVLGDAVLRLAADDTLAPPSGRHGLSQAGAPPDATAGGARALPAAQDVSAAPGAPDLSLPAARSADHAAEPRVVHGCYLHPPAAGLSVPGVNGNRKLHTSGEDVSGGADILPVMPVGRFRLDAGSGATGVLANTRREAAEPAVTVRLPHAVRPTLSSASADAPASGSCCPGC